MKSQSPTAWSNARARPDLPAEGEAAGCTFLVNAGMYLLEPSVYRFVPSGEPLQMTDLIARLLEAGRPGDQLPDLRAVARHRTTRRLRTRADRTGP